MTCKNHGPGGCCCCNSEYAWSKLKERFSSLTVRLEESTVTDSFADNFSSAFKDNSAYRFGSGYCCDYGAVIGIMARDYINSTIDVGCYNGKPLYVLTAGYYQYALASGHFDAFGGCGASNVWLPNPTSLYPYCWSDGDPPYDYGRIASVPTSYLTGHTLPYDPPSWSEDYQYLENMEMDSCHFLGTSGCGAGGETPTTPACSGGTVYTVGHSITGWRDYLLAYKNVRRRRWYTDDLDFLPTGPMDLSLLIDNIGVTTCEFELS